MPSVPMARTAGALCQALVHAGSGGMDFSVVIKFLEGLLGRQG